MVQYRRFACLWDLMLLCSSSVLKAAGEEPFHVGSKHSWTGGYLRPQYLAATVRAQVRAMASWLWRRADAWHRRTPKPPPQLPAASTPLHAYTRALSGVNQPFSQPLGEGGMRGGRLIPQLLARGSRQYLVSHCAMLRCGSVGPARPGPARPTGPALSMHGRPQLSFYFGSMEAYLGPAGPSETMDTVPYPNSGAQTIWRTPGSRRESRRTPLPSQPPRRRPIKPNERVNKAAHRSGVGGAGGGEASDFIKTHYEEQCVVRRENITVRWCAVTNVVMERGSCARFVHRSHPGIESKVVQGNVLG